MNPSSWLRGALKMGEHLSMTLDHKRNQFYDTALKGSVAGKNCIEVGFGTGILSFLALKHGAKHITAFEMDPNKFEMGKHFIRKLKLENQITLHNQYFTTDCIDSSHELLFHELLDINIWGENAYNFMQQCNIPIIPSRYYCDLYLCPITHEQFRKGSEWNNLDQMWKRFYTNVKGPDWPDVPVTLKDFAQLPIMVQQECGQFESIYQMLYKFDPGVEIFPEYVSTFETLIKEWAQINCDQGIYISQELDANEFRDAIHKGTKIGSWEIDTNSKNIIVSTTTQKLITSYDQIPNKLEFVIDKNLIPTGPVAIIPSYRVAHNQTEMTLLDTNEWGSPNVRNVHVLLNHVTDNICIESRLYSGAINAYVC
jgi:hypothetical protein